MRYPGGSVRVLIIERENRFEATVDLDGPTDVDLHSALEAKA